MTLILNNNYEDEFGHPPALNESLNKMPIIKSRNEQVEYNEILNSIEYKNKNLDDLKLLINLKVGNNIPERIEELESQLVVLIDRKQDLEKLEDR